MEKLKIVSIGEVILLLSKLNDETFNKIFVSNEANILSMLDKEKFETSFLTIVPKNDFGLDNINYLDALNIDHLVIQKKDGREPIIFSNENKTIYDRKFSAFYFSSAMDFDFAKELNNATLFHISMDTFSISIDSYKMLISALKLLKKRACKVSLSFKANNFFWNDEQSLVTLYKINKFINFLFLDFNDVKSLTSFKKYDIFDEKSAKDIYNRLKVENLIIYNDNKVYRINNKECIELTSKITFNNENELIARFINNEF